MKFLPAEHACRVVDFRIDRIALVGEYTVETHHVRQLDNLVAFHRIHADAREPGVNLVISEQPAAVISAVLIAAMHMMGIAGGVLEAAVGFGPHNGF